MKKIILLLVLLIFTASVYGITLSNPVSVALGDAYLAKARGFESLHWNPANLGMVDDFMTFNLFQVSSDIRNNALSLGYYNDLMGKYLNADDKQEFLDKMPDTGLSVNVNAGVHMPFSMSVWKFALTINTMVRSSVGLSKEYFDLILHGNEIGVTYNMTDNRGRAVAFVESKIGYGDRLPMESISSSFADLPPIYAGISLGMIHGLAHAEVEEFETEFATNDSVMTAYNNLLVRTAGYDTDNNELISSSIFPGAGAGFRMNIGFTSPINDKLTASLAIKNLFGNINWTEATEEHYVKVEAFDMTINSWNDSVTVDSTYDIPEYSQKIPVEIHLGASYKLGSVTIYSDYVQGFERSLFTSAKPKISVGAEYYPLSWLPLRAGFGFGGDERAHFSMGTGIDFTNFKFDWGLSYYTSPFYTAATGIKFAFGAELAF